MDKRTLVWVVAGIFAVIAAVLGYTLTGPADPPPEESRTVVAQAPQKAADDPCASPATYEGLKQALFEQAAGTENADPDNLGTLAESAVVRMERPVVKSRDEGTNATVCTGRFVLELPPGAERGLNGERRLVADIEYAAQPAADGSGIVYRMSGADALVSRLAAFNLQRQPVQTPGDEMDETELAENGAREPAAPAARPAIAPPPVVRANPPRPKAQPAPVRTASSNPSFNCRNARTRSERMVCASDRLAARDRAMSSRYFSALQRANPRARQVLEQTRGRFLAYRERCPTAECIEEAYEGRMEEIEDIMEDLN